MPQGSPDTLLPPGAAFHHLGVVCKDVDAELRHWQALGYTASSPLYTDPAQQVSVIFLEGAGPCVELVRPEPGNTSLDRYLSSGVKVYHHGYTVSDFDGACARMQGRAVRIKGPDPAVAFGGCRVAFFMLRNFYMVELIERPLP